MTTLNDVARAAGCSAATASRALRGNPRISLATRQRVAEVAKTLRYRGNATARSLRRGESRKIGLIIPNLHNSHYYHDASLLHDLLSHEGYRIILGCHNYDPEQDANILQSLIEHEVDGLIHVPCTLGGAEGVLGPDQGVPLVELGLRSNTEWANSVFSDEGPSFNELVEHLVQLGHKRIALITGREELHHIQVRSTLFHEAVARANLPTQFCPIHYGPASIQWAQDTTHAIVSGNDRATALIVANSPALVGVLLGLKDANKSIPKDVSVIALSSEDWYATSNPPLTAYEYPFREMGMMAAQILLTRLHPDADADPGPSVVGFTGRIIMRESTAAPG